MNYAALLGSALWALLRDKLRMGHAVARAVVFLLAACSAPSEPSLPTMESMLPAGAYYIRASPLVSSTTLKCSNSDRYLGVSIEAFVNVTYDHDVMIARSATSQDGDIEVRLSLSGSRYGTPLVSGSARGKAIDREAASTIGVATLGFSDGASGTASLTGVLSTTSHPIVAGNATGAFQAESIIGRETCQNAQWALDPL